MYYKISKCFQESADPLYKRLWENSAQYPENRVKGSGHRAGMQKVLDEKFVYMGSLSGIQSYAFSGTYNLKSFFFTFISGILPLKILCLIFVSFYVEVLFYPGGIQSVLLPKHGKGKGSA